MIKRPEQGFIPVMLTPFKDSGEIDYDALTQLTEFYLEAGAAGLFANCLSSEMFELEDQEKIKAVQHIVKVVDGIVPVLATGTFGGPVAQQADFVKQIYQTGIQAVIVITGLLAEEHESDAVFNDHIFNLMDQTEKIPLGFYECPVPYKRVLSATQLLQFVATNRVIYHKDTCLDIDQIKAKLKAVEGYNFGLYDAYMGHAVESLKAGVSGLSCIQGNFFPELIVWLCKNYNNASLQTEVNKVQQFLIDNMDVMHDVYPIVAKYYLQKRGLNISTFTRRKVGNFSASNKHKIESLQNDYTYLQQQIA
jgi:4-hydroxy-tetrahydrodipicolinate synthase